MRSTTKATVAKARALRRAMTKPEAVLWRILRDRPGGFRFRRQHPIGPYVLDFYCPSAKLAIEVDGMVHEMGANHQRDERRDAWLRAQGLRILRIPAADVLGSVEAAVVLIEKECGAACPSTAFQAVPLPTPAAQGGQR